MASRYWQPILNSSKYEKLCTVPAIFYYYDYLKIKKEICVNKVVLNFYIYNGSILL